MPSLVIVTYRSDELGPAHPLQIVLGRLATLPSVARISLSPLTRQAVACLAEPYGADADELYDKTGGNPFFVTEVLGSGAASVPPTIRDAVLARAALTGPAGRRLLEAIAVMPAPVEPRLLETLAALAGSDLAHADDCLASGMLVEQRGRIGFRHELARLAVAEAIPPSRRVALHRAALSALTTSSAASRDPASLAHHAEQANDAAAVLEFATAAAERAAAVGAHREAGAHYGRAVRFADSVPLAERARLHEQ